MSKNVPKLRFKGFSDEWEKKHLNNIVERVIRKNKDNITKRPLTISAQYGLVDQEEFFNKVVASKNLEGYYLLENGEFAYNKSYSNGYPFGAIKLLDKYENGAVSTLYICFKNKSNFNTDFLVQYFESDKWYKEVSMIAVEGARNHGLLNISVTDFFETLHVVPEIQEQEKIANFLTKVDKLIEKQEEKIKDLEKYKKGMMQKIFSQEIRFKDENGGEYPAWQDTKFGKCLESISSGKTKEKFDNGKYKVFGSTGVIGYTDSYDYDREHILIARVGANAGTINIINEMCGISDNTLVLTCNNIIDFKFAKYMLINYNLSRLIFGSGQPLVTGGQIKNIDVSIPTFKEQFKIVRLLSNIELILENEELKLNELKEWKKGLLQQMFV